MLLFKFLFILVGVALVISGKGNQVRTLLSNLTRTLIYFFKNMSTIKAEYLKFH